MPRRLLLALLPRRACSRTRLQHPFVTQITIKTSAVPAKPHQKLHLLSPRRDSVRSLIIDTTDVTVVSPCLWVFHYVSFPIDTSAPPARIGHDDDRPLLLLFSNDAGITCAAGHKYLDLRRMLLQCNILVAFCMLKLTDQLRLGLRSRGNTKVSCLYPIS